MDEKLQVCVGGRLWTELAVGPGLEPGKKLSLEREVQLLLCADPQQALGLSLPTPCRLPAPPHSPGESSQLCSHRGLLACAPGAAEEPTRRESRVEEPISSVPGRHVHLPGHVCLADLKNFK